MKKLCAFLLILVLALNCLTGCYFVTTKYSDSVTEVADYESSPYIVLNDNIPEFTEEDYAFLAGKKLDIVSLDCTNGYLNLDYIGHMGIRENKRVREKLLSIGAADAHTVFVANHYSHNGLLPYEEMEALHPGFLISFDGMKVRTPEK